MPWWAITLTNKLIGHRSLPEREHIQRPPLITEPGDPVIPSGLSSGFPELSRSRGQVIYALLTLPPLTPYCYGVRSTCMPNPRRWRSF